MNRAPRRLGMVTGSSTPLSVFGLKNVLVVSKLPGRVERPGMNSLEFDAPFTWQVPQLIRALRAAPPRIEGELKARLPRFEKLDLRPWSASEWKTSRGMSIASWSSSELIGKPVRS